MVNIWLDITYTVVIILVENVFNCDDYFSWKLYFGKYFGRKLHFDKCFGWKLYHYKYFGWQWYHGKYTLKTFFFIIFKIIYQNVIFNQNIYQKYILNNNIYYSVSHFHPKYTEKIINATLLFLPPSFMSWTQRSKTLHKRPISPKYCSQICRNLC